MIIVLRNETDIPGKLFRANFIDSMVGRLANLIGTFGNKGIANRPLLSPLIYFVRIIHLKQYTRPDHAISWY